MKQLKYLLLAVVVVLSIVGCRKDVEVSFDKTAQEMEAQGGSVEIALKSNGEWSISTVADWFTVSPMSGNGDATLTISAEANITGEVRSAQITASTKDNTATLTVSQNAQEYYLTVTPREIQCGSDGGEFTVTVSSNVEWRISMPQWITSSVTEGSNDTTVTLSVAPIAGELAEPRSGDVVFGNLFSTGEALVVSDQIHVIQTVDPVLGIELTPKNLEFVCTGEAKTVVVSTQDIWTASVEGSWVNLSQIEGQGETEIIVTVDENPFYVERRTSVLFSTAGGVEAMLSIRQEASIVPHFLEASPLEIEFGKEGGERAITIACDTDWEFHLESNWLSLSQLSGTGDATVVLTAEQNLVAEPRAAEFYIKSGLLFRTFTVSQAAGDEPIVGSFEPDTLLVTYVGGIQHVQLSSNCSWQLQASEWIRLDATVNSGQGDASLDIIIDSNSDPEERVGYLKAVHNGQVLCTLVVVQEGKPNILETDIAELDVPFEGGEYVIQVTSNQAWGVVADVDWLHCHPESGFASGSFTITVDASSALRPRTGYVKLRGELGAQVMIRVNQH